MVILEVWGGVINKETLMMSQTAREMCLSFTLGREKQNMDSVL